jgi:hypothetical protein
MLLLKDFSSDFKAYNKVEIQYSRGGKYDVRLQETEIHQVPSIQF